MDTALLNKRIQHFAANIFSIVKATSKYRAGYSVNRQMSIYSTLVGANCNPARRVLSKPHFISKTHTIDQQAVKSCYGLPIMIEAGLINHQKTQELLRRPSGLPKFYSNR
jgi:hypothetical protein